MYGNFHEYYSFRELFIWYYIKSNILKSSFISHQIRDYTNIMCVENI